VGTFIVVVLVLALYMLPAIVASFRHKRNEISITLVNVFLGWTFIGWVVALAWACSYEPPRPKEISVQDDPRIEEKRKNYFEND
jgi:uncharacterized membrane protein